MRLASSAALLAVLAACGSGCIDQDPRILPFAQPKLELLVGESIDVSVALSGPAKKQMLVDVSSELDGVSYEPTTLTYETGQRVASVKLTGANSTRGAFQPVRFDLRGTDTGNSLLILVSNVIDPSDGGGSNSADGSPDQPKPDGPAGDSTVDGAQPDAGVDTTPEAGAQDGASEASADGASNG